MGTYSQEFKDQIVELHRRYGRTFMDLGKEFDLSPTTVANWTWAADQREAAKAARRPPAAVSRQSPTSRRSPGWSVSWPARPKSGRSWEKRWVR